MQNPSDQTIETYRQNFDQYVERTRDEPSLEFKGWMDSFASQLPKDGEILEIGSATGRDARYFAWEVKNPINKTICHGDFHPNHILYNKSSKSIIGIIDFGRICINDPAVDFNLIERFFGNEAIEKVLQFYNLDVSKNFKKRITFQNRRRLFAAFFHAKAVEQTSSFPRYLERIETTFSD